MVFFFFFFWLQHMTSREKGKRKEKKKGNTVAYLQFNVPIHQARFLNVYVRLLGFRRSHKYFSIYVG
jgi:hypothetical protein